MPEETPKYKETNPIHLDSGIGFHAPTQIRTSPRGEMITPGGIPDKSQYMLHLMGSAGLIGFTGLAVVQCEAS